MNEMFIINVDFPTKSIIHVNTSRQTDLRCKTGLKKPEHGGFILATKEEVINYLNGTTNLEFHGKKVDNLRPCKICHPLVN